MKRFFTFLILFLAALVVCPAYSQEEDSPDYPEQPSRLEPEPKPKRKRMPSKDYIECFYVGDGFILTPMYCEDVTAFTITVTNGLEWYEGETDEANGYYFFTGPLKGSYTITCVAGNGRTYVGTTVLP